MKKRSNRFSLAPVRRPVEISEDDLVRSGPFREEQPLPFVFQPKRESIEPFLWIARNRENVDAKLLEHGAVLFHDFGIDSPAGFRGFVEAVCGGVMKYSERSSPRSEIADRIYTSTDYPSNQSIFPHNEHSYSVTVPQNLAFWCSSVALNGGETPLGDTRRIYSRVAPAVREKFERLGWMYVRNFDGKCGLAWETVFRTSERSQVEDYCRRANIEFEWKRGNELRTRQVRPAVLRHPRTSELLWFNHAAFFHVSTLPHEVQRVLKSEYCEQDLPNNTYYGDGSPLEDATVDALRDAYRSEMWSFPWQKGDLLLIDNLLTAHARNPFTGPRQVLVAMANPFTRTDHEFHVRVDNE